MSSSIWSRGGGGVGRNNNSTTSNNSHSNSISSQGFRKAKGQVGKIPSELELLASPSRGLDTSDEASLRNVDVQNRFREFITQKLIKFDQDYKEPVDPVSKASALSIILLDFRKLREGITSSGRNDLFSAEVYESSARLAIYADNMQQLGACLPHLVFTLHPSLLLPSIPTSINELASLSIQEDSTSTTSIARSIQRKIPELHSFYQSLYLLYLISHLSDLSAYHPTLSTFLSNTSTSSTNSDPNPTNLPPDLEFANKIYTALLSSNYISLSRLIYPSESTTLKSSSQSNSLPPLSPAIKLNLQLSLLRKPKIILNWREKAWERIDKSYKLFDDFDWLSRALLFEKGDEKGVKEYLLSKGKSW